MTPPRSPQASSSSILPEGSIQISKPTGEKQCGNDKPTPLSEVMGQLSKKKIKVYESHTQADGMAHIDLCGAPVGNINIFTISKKDLSKALKLGFKEVKN
jgi:hypothetical protein